METSKAGVIIADTSGLVSLLLPGDHNHKVALKAARKLQTGQKSILVPAAVFVELLNILGRKVGHHAALAAVSELSPPFVVLTTQTNIAQAQKKFAELPPFTAQLLRELIIAGRDIEVALKAVRAGVQQTTGGEQIPWVASSMTGDFYITR